MSAPARLSCGLFLLLAACKAGSAPAPAPAPATTSGGATAAPATAAAATVGPKAPLAGLVDMQDIAWHNADGGEPTFAIDNVAKYPGAFGGVVINATWRNLQPTEGGPLQPGAVDDALAKVRAYNAAHPDAPLGVKLRVYGGSTAPEWAKRIAGGPVHIERNPKGCAQPPCALTIGKHWTEPYVAAWRRFQGLLAARYDGEPLVRHVTVTSCAAQTDEPFVSSVAKPSREALSGAGYDDAAQQRCLMNAVDDYAAWKNTLVDFTFNVFVKNEGGVEPAFTTSVIRHCRDALGPRCVLGNHALSAPLREADQTVYDTIASMKGPISFQTEAPRGMGCRWRATIAQGVSLGAQSIEVWPNYDGFTTLEDANVRELAKEFASPIAIPQPAGSCGGFH